MAHSASLESCFPSKLHPQQCVPTKIPLSFSPCLQPHQTSEFSLQHEQRIPAPGTGIFPEGGLRAEDMQAQAHHPLLNGKQMKQFWEGSALGRRKSWADKLRLTEQGCILSEGIASSKVPARPQSETELPPPEIPLLAHSGDAPWLRASSSSKSGCSWTAQCRYHKPGCDYGPVSSPISTSSSP